MGHHSALYSSTGTTSDWNKPNFSFNGTMQEFHTLPSVATYSNPPLDLLCGVPISSDITTEVHKCCHWFNSCAIRILQFHWGHTSDLPFPPCHPLTGLPTCALFPSISYWDAPLTCSVTAEHLQCPQHLSTSITTLCLMVHILPVAQFGDSVHRHRHHVANRLP